MMGLSFDIEGVWIYVPLLMTRDIHQINDLSDLIPYLEIIYIKSE